MRPVIQLCRAAAAGNMEMQKCYHMKHLFT